MVQYLTFYRTRGSTEITVDDDADMELGDFLKIWQQELEPEEWAMLFKYFNFGRLYKDGWVLFYFFPSSSSSLDNLTTLLTLFPLPLFPIFPPSRISFSS